MCIIFNSQKSFVDNREWKPDEKQYKEMFATVTLNSRVLQLQQATKHGVAFKAYPKWQKIRKQRIQLYPSSYQTQQINSHFHIASLVGIASEMVN